MVTTDGVVLRRHACMNSSLFWNGITKLSTPESSFGQVTIYTKVMTSQQYIFLFFFKTSYSAFTHTTPHPLDIYTRHKVQITYPDWSICNSSFIIWTPSKWSTIVIHHHLTCFSCSSFIPSTERTAQTHFSPGQHTFQACHTNHQDRYHPENMSR